MERFATNADDIGLTSRITRISLLLITDHYRSSTSNCSLIISVFYQLNHNYFTSAFICIRHGPRVSLITANEEEERKRGREGGGREREGGRKWMNEWMMFISFLSYFFASSVLHTRQSSYKIINFFNLHFLRTPCFSKLCHNIFKLSRSSHLHLPLILVYFLIAQATYLLPFYK